LIRRSEATGASRERAVAQGVGFTVPANVGAYWVGEAMGSTNYVDLPEIPEKVRETLDTLATNTVHLARLLKERPYPGLSVEG
jgi:hypothetical protein